MIMLTLGVEDEGHLTWPMCCSVNITVSRTRSCSHANQSKNWHFFHCCHPHSSQFFLSQFFWENKMHPLLTNIYSTLLRLTGRNWRNSHQMTTASHLCSLMTLKWFRDLQLGNYNIYNSKYFSDNQEKQIIFFISFLLVVLLNCVTYQVWQFSIIIEVHFKFCQFLWKIHNSPDLEIHVFCVIARKIFFLNML